MAQWRMGRQMSYWHVVSFAGPVTDWMAQVRVAGSVCQIPQENMNPSLLKLLQANTLERCKNSFIGRNWEVSKGA